jgi:hypothetical protein
VFSEASPTKDFLYNFNRRIAQNLSLPMIKTISYILGVLLAIGCSKNNKLPNEKYYQFTFPAKYSHNNNTLRVEITNPLNCPLRISISSPDKSLLDIVAKFGTLTLKEKSDTMINYYLKTKRKYFKI